MTGKVQKLLTMLFLVTALVSVGCSSKSKKSSGGDSPNVSASSDGADYPLELNGDSDSNTAGQLTTVYFAYDSSRLSGSTRASLNEAAEYLKSNEGVSVQVEGHCDERGGVQYNLALGQSRAKATQDYLVALGVDSSRITTISFGKERPKAYGHDEDSWSQNRRANFVITSK
jgi:peptidoglycan-associated lipoprotein